MAHPDSSCPRDSECLAQAGAHLVGPLHDLAGAGRDLLDNKGEEDDGHNVLTHDVDDTSLQAVAGSGRQARLESRVQIGSKIKNKGSL